MAGQGFVKFDPAIDRWYHMRDSVYKHFRFTPKTTVQSIIGMIVVPVTFYAIASSTDLRWDWKGKKKDQSLTA